MMNSPRTRIGRDRGNGREAPAPVVDKTLDDLSAPDKTLKPGSITAPRFAVLTLGIKNVEGSPLVIHNFSSEQRGAMQETQEAGSQAKKGKARKAKNFEKVFHAARYISTSGWDGINAACFRNAMIAVCRLVGFKMTLGKMAIFVEADGIEAGGRTPLVRIYGERLPWQNSITPARNASGVADLRCRPTWQEWKAVLRIRYDMDLFNELDVVNLLVRAGQQNGICEGRPSSTRSNGLGWGLFELDRDVVPQLHVLPEQTIEFQRT